MPTEQDLGPMSVVHMTELSTPGSGEPIQVSVSVFDYPGKPGLLGAAIAYGSDPLFVPKRSFTERAHALRTGLRCIEARKQANSWDDAVRAISKKPGQPMVHTIEATPPA